MKVSKTMTNLEIAELLRDIAAAYELADAKRNKFKIIAYERAADSVEHATSELKDLWEENKLGEIAGLGSSIQEHLNEIFKTGKSKHFEELTKDIPKVVFELMKVPGIGVKTAMKLVSQLDIKSLKQLKEAASEVKIAKLPDFGQESQARILKSVIDFAKKAPSRLLLPYADQLADEVCEWMKQDKNAIRIEKLGSLRRRAATVGDIDIAVTTDSPAVTIKQFISYPKATRVLEKGARTAGIILPGNIEVDLMVCRLEAFGALLQHFTGSKLHNIALREHALKRGLSLSDYGIVENSKIKKFKSEEELYGYLGMEWIPPEIREDSGEIEASLGHKLPQLVELSDIKGDLHIHSDFDIETSHDLGLSSMESLVKRAFELKYEYVAFSEHNPSRSKHNDKQIVEILKKKRETIDKLNYSITRLRKTTARQENIRVFKVFNSLEIDIMPDGSLPVPPAGLATLDFALVSIHSSFDLPRLEMTRRVLRAFNHPKVKIFAHPTARKLNERDGIDLDWEKIFEACIKKHIWLEINSDPARLDLPDILVHEAIKKGVKMTIDTDSHHVDSMGNTKWGVSVARRGWAEAKNIANTRSLEEFDILIK